MINNSTYFNKENQPTIVKPMKEYCQNCKLENKTTIREMEETYSVRGESINILAMVRVCSKCNKPIFDEELDSQNIERAFDKYRINHDILTAEQIEDLRKTYGLSQRGLAILLNWSPATVARYEQGSIPSPSHHAMLINLKKNVEHAKNLFEQAKTSLGRLDARRMKERLTEIDKSSQGFDTILLLSKKYNYIGEKDPLYSGFTDFEFNKLANMVSYFTSNIPKISKTKLMKLLFYADFSYFKECGLSISGLSYRHLPFGPVPVHHWLMLEALTENKIIELKPFGDFEGEYLETIYDADLSLFDEDELNVMNRIINYFKTFNAERISDYSHGEIAYIKTNDKEYISYEFADQLKDFS